MAIDPAILLRRLAPPVRPHGVERPGRPFESRDFEELLDLAAAGSVVTGRPVHLPDELEDALPREDLDRLARGADLAQAAGFDRAVLLLRGRAFLLDVPDRRVTDAADAPDADRTIPVDGVVALAADEASPAAPRVFRAPGSGVAPAFLADAPTPARPAEPDSSTPRHLGHAESDA